jgi:DNA repair protein RadC
VDSNLNGNKRIADLAPFERPREKAFAYGVKTLSSKELLALMIGSGVQGHSALVIADMLLNRYGSLIGLMRVPLHEWLTIPGFKKTKAIQLLGMFELFQRIEKHELPTVKLNDPAMVYRHYRLRLGSLLHEQLIIIKLNHQYHYTSETLFRLGSQSSLQLDYRDLFVDLLKTDTKKFLLLHNHPSGDVTPSQEDITTTIDIQREAKKLGFMLIDHLIISFQGYFSMRQEKII